MNYKVAIGIVFLIHMAFTAFTILLSSGDGSFVGLFSMILALYGTPMTLITNFFIIRAHRKHPKAFYISFLLMLSSIVPFLQIALFIAKQAFNL